LNVDALFGEQRESQYINNFSKFPSARFVSQEKKMESSNSAPPATSSVLFARGVIARLAIWATLRIAVQENWGGAHGSEKRTWLASVIVDAFEEQVPAPDDQYIEEMLLQVMADEFEAVVEDGSAESVAQDVVKIWDQTRIGKDDLVKKFEELAEKMKGKKASAQEKVVSDDEDEGDWEDGEGDEEDEMEEDEAPQLMQLPLEERKKEGPEVDEEGFTVVRGKGKGRR
jgi:pre-rRNA-processing protein TSR2